MGVRDTTSTLLPPVALPGELATLDRASKIREAGQSNNNLWWIHPDVLSRGLLACKAARSLWVRAPRLTIGVRAGAGRAARFREERPVCGRCGDAARR